MHVCVYIYIFLYQNFRVTTHQKSIIDTLTNKKKQSKYNIKDSHQTTREENKKRREEKDQQKQIQNNQQNGSKNTHIENYLKCKWTKCCNQKI